MLGIGWEDLSGRYLLECMPLQTTRQATNVGGSSVVVYVEHCVILWLSRYLMVRLRKR